MLVTVPSATARLGSAFGEYVTFIELPGTVISNVFAVTFCTQKVPFKLGLVFANTTVTRPDEQTLSPAICLMPCAKAVVNLTVLFVCVTLDKDPSNKNQLGTPTPS